TMWCMLNSPLLAGNDLRKMSPQTIEILTNKEVIALNQDTGFIQAKRVYKNQNIEVWQKPLATGKEQAIAIINRGVTEKLFTLNTDKFGVANKYIRDLWLHKDLGKIGKEKIFTLPKHGVIVLKVY
ncbi:MAG TPA: glycoside hydrolase family 27 protein, partial [Chitinophagales bacterium]|nr:glycoside hydrolase family 27 protein [Chitinophagales bacterium]